jgi:hypothetical protein
VGRDAFAEALFAGEGKEEVAGWIEGYLWKIEGDDGEDFKLSAGETNGAADEAADEPVQVTEAVTAKDVDEVRAKTENLKV